MRDADGLLELPAQEKLKPVGRAEQPAEQEDPRIVGGFLRRREALGVAHSTTVCLQCTRGCIDGAGIVSGMTAASDSGVDHHAINNFGKLRFTDIGVMCWE